MDLLQHTRTPYLHAFGTHAETTPRSPPHPFAVCRVLLLLLPPNGLRVWLDELVIHTF
jgi:hypothetical protein